MLKKNGMNEVVEITKQTLVFLLGTFVLGTLITVECYYVGLSDGISFFLLLTFIYLFFFNVFLFNLVMDSGFKRQPGLRLFITAVYYIFQYVLTMLVGS